MFDGDIVDDELEIGQVSTNLNKIQSASSIIDEIMGLISNCNSLSA